MHTRATLPTDRCHLNDAAIRIHRQHRNTPLSGKKTWSSELSASMRTCSRWQRMCSSSGMSRLRLREGRASKSRLRGRSDKAFIALNRAGIALVPRGSAVCRETNCPSAPLQLNVARQKTWSREDKFKAANKLPRPKCDGLLEPRTLRKNPGTRPGKVNNRALTLALLTPSKQRTKEKFATFAVRGLFV